MVRSTRTGLGPKRVTLPLGSPSPVSECLAQASTSPQLKLSASVQPERQQVFALLIGPMTLLRHVDGGPVSRPRWPRPGF